MGLLRCAAIPVARRSAMHQSQNVRVASRSREWFCAVTKQHQLTPPLSAAITRSFSNVAADADAAAATTKDPSAKNEKTKKDDSNLFLDNLGKIFLGSIGLIIASLVRSSYSGGNRIKVREHLEDTAALDPLEMDDLRVANSELTPNVFRLIMQDVQQAFPHDYSGDSDSLVTVTYTDFCHVVRKTMVRLKGDAFTVELGHLLDRAVLAALDRQEKREDEPVPLLFLLAALSMALSSSVDERIDILYEAMMQQSKNNYETVTYEDVRAMVGYLQDTCQLVPDAQVVEADTKYPTQQYERGSPEQLVKWNGSDQDVMDVEAFAAIVRSKSVCAWGECYNRRK